MTEMHKRLRAPVDASRANRVEMTLSTEPGTPLVVMTVFSACRPQFGRRVTVHHQGADDRTARVVAASAGAAAESLNEQYTDRLDPERCANVALKLFVEALRKARLDDAAQVKGVLQ